MTRWSMINYWTILVFTSALLIFLATFARPACGAPPPKKTQSSAKKRSPHQPVISPDMAFLRQLPIAESVGFFSELSLDSENGEFDPSPPFTKLHYRSAVYVDAAVRLQALGKDKACQDLLQLGQWEYEQNDQTGYRAIVLCRMLFVSRSDQEFRRALTGDNRYFGGTTDSDWPLEPIVLIDQVPFIIALEYGRSGGYPESPAGYVQYCIDHCDWSTTKYRPLTKPQEEEALQKLYALPVWKEHLTTNLKAYFAHQISLP